MALLSNPITKWVANNRVIVSSASVIGSLAGLLFSFVDLKDSLARRKRQKAAKKG